MSSDRGETWALDQLKGLKPVRFPPEWSEEDRTVSGEFVVEAMVDGRWAETSQGFLLANAILRTPVQRRYAEVGGELRFEHCVFKEGVALPYARFHRRVHFLGCTFRSSVDMSFCCGSELGFEELRSDRSADSVPTVFWGNASLVDSTIGGHLHLEKVEFRGEDNIANLRGIKVEGVAFFDGSSFEGRLDLSYCTFLQSLVLVGVRFLRFCDLSKTSVGATLFVFAAPQQDGAWQTFDTQLPPEGDLRGLTYDRSDLGDDDRWRTWVDGMRRPGHFDADPYLTLERCFRRAGQDDLADNVHFKMRKDQGGHFWAQGRTYKWAINCLWRWSVGYGVKGWRLWGWAVPLPALLFVTLLIVCPWPHRSFDAVAALVLYTLDVFLPLDLHQGDVCGQLYPGVRMLKFVTELWGWLIVPAGLAQLAGLLKKAE